VKTLYVARLTAVAICMAAIFGCQGGSPTGTKSETKKEGKTVAEVNGAKITTGDFENELKNLPEYLKSMAESPQGRKDMLDTMIFRELILQQAAKDGLDKDPSIEERLNDLRKRLIVEAFLKKKVEADSQLSDDELKKFYDKNIDKFKTGEQIRASHILVKAEKDAKDILSQLKSGANFEELAKKNSIDSSSAKGGDIGWFGKGNMVPPFEKAVFALKEGEISNIVKTDFGYHIIKRTGSRPAGIRPFEEVKEQIKAALIPTKQQQVFQKIKDELKNSAKITIKDDVLNPLNEKEGMMKPAESASKSSDKK